MRTLIELALATPVCLWSAWPFYLRAIASVRRKRPNMFTLIGLGVSVAYLYSFISSSRKFRATISAASSSSLPGIPSSSTMGREPASSYVRGMRPGNSTPGRPSNTCRADGRGCAAGISSLGPTSNDTFPLSSLPSTKISDRFREIPSGGGLLGCLRGNGLPAPRPPAKGESPMELLAWWNLVFLIPGSMGIMLALLSAIGLGEGGEHDLAADADHDIDVAPDHDIDVAPDHDIDVAPDHDIDVAPDHAGAVEIGEGGEASPDSGFLSDMLSLLGWGRVPLMLFLTIFCLSFSFLGLGLNRFLSAFFSPAAFFPLSLLGAAAGGGLLTGISSRTIARFLPKEESYAVGVEALVGEIGHVVALLSPQEGYLQVRDRFGNLHEMRCKRLDGKPLSKEGSVIVARVDPQERLCFVMENELDAIEEPKG
ncbi:MAG: DUF1449 family protein [Deltaproteobacteria bacterium]|nr:MAG: DUF1449 family protein [Deltaproteobacteria bacterium]